MKKSGLPLTLLLLTFAFSANAQPDREAPDTTAEAELDYSFADHRSIQPADVVAKYPFIKFQDDVNDEAVADAYPWLSADGLRLYFVRGSQAYKSERASLNQSFAPPTLVDMQMNESLTSVWLSNDELEMFCSNSNVILHFKRNSQKETFRFHWYLEIDERVAGFISGASFTPDMKTMMLYNSNGRNRLVILDVGVDGVCTYRTELKSKDGTMGIGQISKDGKSVYFSVEDSVSTILYKTELLLIGTPKEELKQLFTFPDVRLGKPSLNFDETLITLNYTASNAWEENEIVILDMKELKTYPEQGMPTASAQTNPTDLIMGEPMRAPCENYLPKPEASILNPGGAYDFVLAIENAYPVPSRDQLTLVYHLPVNCAMAELIITDICGKEVLHKRIDPKSRTAEISFKELKVAQGHYFVWINSNLGISATHKVSYMTE